MSLGVEAAGFDLVAAIEIDPVHAATHHFNFPHATTLCRDISKLEVTELDAAVRTSGAKDVDLVVGGPPCQGFSHIGRRQLDDPRNRLVFEYCRIVDHLRPKYFIFENVPGMASGKHRVFLDELIGEFNRIGYEVCPPRILDASDFGVAEKRRRLILLGHRRDCPPLPYPLPPGSSNGKAQGLAALSGVVGAASAIGDLEKHDVYIGKDSGIHSSTLDYSGYRSNFRFNTSEAFERCHRRTLKAPIVYGHVGSRHTTESVDRFSQTSPGETEKISRFFKLHPEKPCHTLRAGTASNRGAYTAPRPIHYAQPRCISVREAARLHSFPDWFQFHRTVWHGFRQIGNSVAPLFARELGEVVLDALGLHADRIPTTALVPQDDSLLKFNMREAEAYFDVPRNTIAPRQRVAAGG
jgi:DNA (cytosine-5)-methyltransferase 1